MIGYARELGLPLRLVGRRRDALAELARAGEEVWVADAGEVDGLVAAFEGACAVVSLAGPFVRVGFGPVEAAIRTGVHYLDSSGEQAFARQVHSRFGAPAAERGVVLLTSFGFDFAPGDLAARLAAESLEPLDEVDVAYAVARVAASRGTRRTIADVLEADLVAWEDGRLVPSRIGATVHSFRFPWGERIAVEWGGTEPLTVPRHTEVSRVRSYVRAPRLAARFGGWARLAAPLARGAARVGRAGPSRQARQRARFAVVAEARGPQGGRRVTLAGRDVYGLTGLLLARGAEALARGEARGAGALAPAEAFDARAFAERLSPLLRVDSVEEL